MFNNNFIFLLKFDLEKYVNVEWLYLDGNFIVNIKKGVFLLFIWLIEINILINKLESIEDGVFCNLILLIIFILSNNYIFNFLLDVFYNVFNL